MAAAELSTDFMRHGMKRMRQRDGEQEKSERGVEKKIGWGGGLKKGWTDREKDAMKEGGSVI